MGEIKNKMALLRRELQSQGFGRGNTKEDEFSYAAAVDKKIRAMEDLMETGELGTATMSRLQHEKHLTKELQQMKKFKPKGEAMDALVKSISDKQKSEGYVNAMSRNKEMRAGMDDIREKRKVIQNENSKVRDQLREIRNQITTMLTARKAKSDKINTIQTESRGISDEFRNKDKKHQKYQQDVNKAQNKVLNCKRALDDAQRTLTQMEMIADAAEPEAAMTAGGSGSRSPMNAPAAKPKQMLRTEDNAPKPSQMPNPEKKKRKPKKPAKGEDKEEERVSNVQTIRTQNMTQIKDITALITYLHALSPGEDTGATGQKVKSTRGGFGGELYAGVAEDDPMASLFNAQPKKKTKKKRKKKIRTDLQHSMESLTQFAKYNIDYPLKIDEIPKCLEALQKKLAEYKAPPKKKNKEAKATTNGGSKPDPAGGTEKAEATAS